MEMHITLWKTADAHFHWDSWSTYSEGETERLQLKGQIDSNLIYRRAIKESMQRYNLMIYPCSHVWCNEQTKETLGFENVKPNMKWEVTLHWFPVSVIRRYNCLLSIKLDNQWRSFLLWSAQQEIFSCYLIPTSTAEMQVGEAATTWRQSTCLWNTASY